jgi:hypothetical protein
MLNDIRLQRDKWKQQAERLALTDAPTRQAALRELKTTIIITGCGLGLSYFGR